MDAYASMSGVDENEHGLGRIFKKVGIFFLIWFCSSVAFGLLFYAFGG